jgi:hypothetical protein
MEKTPRGAGFFLESGRPMNIVARASRTGIVPRSFSEHSGDYVRKRIAAICRYGAAAVDVHGLGRLPDLLARQCFFGGVALDTCAMTSATKSSCFFSIPAPTSKRS